jgi:transposase InsO family protein
MLTGSILILVMLLTYCLYRRLSRYRYRTGGWRKQPPAEYSTTFPRHPPKPDWVRQEIIRLKALMPHDGCRTIAQTFNRRYAEKRQMSVGKTLVSYTIRNHQYDIQVLRRQLKHQRPRTVPKHLIWGADLTYFTDEAGQPRPVLGIVEHHSRTCLKLEVLRTKASTTLLRCLLDAIDAIGQKPRYLRTDNEAVFTSSLFRLGLWLLGIRQQRTEAGCPWQNGRIERFFGTLKRKARDLVFISKDTLPQELHVFRFWYNHIRPHQYLDGQTPAEAYRGGGRIGVQYRKKPDWFEAWDGRLTGYWHQPG